MNILQNIKIGGDVFQDYAYLSYVMSFENNSDISAEYSFYLPDGAQISSFKIYTGGKMLDSKIVSASHASMLLSDEEAFAILSKVSRTEYLLNIGSLNIEGCKILLTVYAPVNKNRIIFPLVGRGFKSGAAEHTVSFCLNITDGADVDISSPTHDVFITNKADGCAEVTSGDIQADRDFCLCVGKRKKCNSAVVVEGINGGEMLCRINLREKKFAKPKKLLLIYDSECGFTKSESQIARSFIYYAAKLFDGLFAVADRNGMITDGYKENCDENIDKLLYSLSDIRVNENKTMALPADKDVLLVCVTNSVTKAGDDGVNYVSVGNISSLIGQHIYSADDVFKRTEEIVKSFSERWAVENIFAVARGAKTEVIGVAESGMVTIYLRYFVSPPRTVEIVCGENRTEENIYNIKIYKSFSSPGLLYADKEIQKLLNRLRLSQMEDIPEIRKKIEQIGIKYSALNSETALVIRLGTKSAVVKTVIPSEINNSPGANVNTASMFRESQSFVPGEVFVRYCISLIAKSIRADGAICADGEVCCDARKMQTEICVMALIASGVSIENKTLMLIKSFLKKDIKKDKNVATEFLQKLFKQPSYIPENTKPDLITAARAVWQSVQF